MNAFLLLLVPRDGPVVHVRDGSEAGVHRTPDCSFGHCDALSIGVGRDEKTLEVNGLEKYLRVVSRCFGILDLKNRETHKMLWNITRYTATNKQCDVMPFSHELGLCLAHLQCCPCRPRLFLLNRPQSILHTKNRHTGAV